MEYILSLTARDVALGAVAYLVLVNLMAVSMFREDKRRAMYGEWRSPEQALLLVAFIGGSLGAKYAQRRYRHKTRKQPFARALNAIMIFHAVVLVAALFAIEKVRLYVLLFLIQSLLSVLSVFASD